jgi:hypothetical protein
MIIGGFFNFSLWRWTDIAKVFYKKTIDTRDRVSVTLDSIISTISTCLNLQRHNAIQDFSAS